MRRMLEFGHTVVWGLSHAGPSWDEQLDGWCSDCPKTDLHGIVIALISAESSGSACTLLQGDQVSPPWYAHGMALLCPNRPAVHQSLNTTTLMTG